ncbi:MAG: ABC transporter substrate-binding protein [Lactobacillus sp.]|jgi:branched-chain amino acid transport system substrate-binding protein|nr:ABC transporter substrate-binding protein [Lactobacillus sp.]
MKKLAVVLGVFIVVGILVWIYSPDQKENVENKPVVKIGVVMPLTGEWGYIGVSNQGAIDVALKDLGNQSTKYNYEVIFEDSQFNAYKTANIISKLINVDKVDAVISGFSLMGNIISPITEKNRVIHINSFGSDANIARGKYNFMNWTMPEAEVYKLIEVINDKGYKNVVTISLNDSGTLAQAKVIDEKLKVFGVTHSIRLINPGARDMRLEIQKAEASGVELYILQLYNPENSIFIRQLRELGSKADVTAIETFSIYEDKSIVEGAWYIDASASNNDVTKRILEHNASVNTYGITNSYDNVMLLVKSFESALSKDEAVEELAKIKEYNGVTGALLQDDEGIFHSEAIVKVVKNGEILIEE